MNEIYLVPSNGRVFLKTADGSIKGSKTGYATKQKAEAARWFLTQGKQAIEAVYRSKREMANELSHFKNI